MSFYKEVPGRQTTLESTLKFDTTPTEGSTNPVTSDGVKSAIDGAVGDATAALQDQIDDIAEKAGSGYIPKGEATVATLNGLSGQENGDLYTMTDAGTLTDGSLAVSAGDTVAWDEANSVWYKAMDYAPRQYGTNEVHNLATTITAFRTGDVILVDGPSGTAKMAKDDLLRVTAEEPVSAIINAVNSYTETLSPAQPSWTSVDFERNYFVASEIYEYQISDASSFSFDVYGWEEGSNSPEQFAHAITSEEGLLVIPKTYVKIRFFDVNGNTGFSVTLTKKSINESVEDAEKSAKDFAFSITENAIYPYTETRSPAKPTWTDVDFERNYFFKDEEYEFEISNASNFAFDVYGWEEGSNSPEKFYDKLISVKGTIVIPKTYVKIRFFDTKSNTGFSVTLTKKGVEEELNLVRSNGYVEITSTTRTAEQPVSLKKGQRIAYKVTLDGSNQSTSNVSCYVKELGTSNYVQLTFPRLKGVEYYDTIPCDASSIRFYNGRNYSVGGQYRIVGTQERCNEFEYKFAVKPLKILIIGDSYSADQQNYRQYLQQFLPKGTSIITLATTGASVKDKYQDKVTYPYTSRPNENDSSGNLNTFACQIEKLERLMLGQDLDVGEQAIYQTPESYPDVILIAGGMNDTYDASETTYYDQFRKFVSGVYVKRNSSEPTASLDSCFVVPPLSEVDQTTFAGAYRYLVEKLWTKFPRAEIFCTTRSGLGFWRTQSPEYWNKIVQQQKFVFELCGVNQINWHRETNISCIRNYPPGSGTMADPYMWSASNGEDFCDNKDGMHPNVLGARKIAQYTANKILSTYFMWNLGT